MKKNSILFALLLAGGLVSAQQNFWGAQSKGIINEGNLVPRVHHPSESVKMNLNYNQLVQFLTETESRNSKLELKFPDSNGQLKDYLIQERSNLHPDLQARYSTIRSYVGYNVQNPTERINFSISPQFGLYGIINSADGDILIDTYTSDKSSYIIYNKSKISTESVHFNCDVEAQDVHNSGLGIDNLDFSSVPGLNQGRTTVSDNKLVTFRTAITTTTEYSNYIINRANVSQGTDAEKKAAILAAVNISLTRINGVLRNDAGVHLQLIPNTDQLFFLTTDTFTVESASQMLNENISVTNRIIGAANYDLGHLFFKVNSAGDSNGLAATPSVCNDSRKAGGVTGTVAPIGDPFDIDFTAHEMGHQFGAMHTQNNECNRSEGSSVEPGSGSTIMAYTGICDPNVQANSDSYYHQNSINQINTTLNSVTCGTKTETTNVPPVITLTKTSYNIPHSTAFVLEMSATDANADNLTYSWEQINSEVGQNMPPLSANTQGPMFRSFQPSQSPVRFFPRMEKILNNQHTFTSNPYYGLYSRNNWEVLPNNPRLLTFAATVRDNNLDVGLTSSRILTVRTRPAGPFKVTSQTTNEIWNAGEEATITWDVAGTTANSINTSDVKIVLSLDGGQTWNYTIVESTPNNGSYTFTVPQGLGQVSTARLMIKPINNIYLAVNSKNFTINSTLSISEINKAEDLKITPNPSKGFVKISTAKNYKNMTIAINDMVGKQVFEQNKSNVNTQEINVSHLPNGIYIVTIKADGEQFSKKLVIKK